MPATRSTPGHTNRAIVPEDIVREAKQVCMAHGHATTVREIQIIRSLLAMIGRLERRDNPEYKNITWDKE
jgi:hypothetical protein